MRRVAWATQVKGVLMPGVESDLQLAGRIGAPAPERAPESQVEPSHVQELTARAVAAGRPDTLDTPAVVRLQAFAGNASVSRLLEDDAAPDKVRSVVGKGGGQPLAPDIAQTMGARFGADFSDVRIHQGGAAAESARAVDAHAYTVGNDVVFGAGKYDPASPAGQRTLAHELTHVVQQRAGDVSGTAIGGGLSVSHPMDGFEQEASRTADRVMSGAAPSAPVAAQRHAADETPVAQREGAPEEEEEPGAVAQREGAPEEEEEPGAVAQREEAPEEEEQPGGAAPVQREGAAEEEEMAGS